MSNDSPLLEDLNLSEPALDTLHVHGFVRLADLQHLSNVQILMLPNVGGQSYKRILAALGRQQAAGLRRGSLA
jgi:hypothetical protein